MRKYLALLAALVVVGAVMASGGLAESNGGGNSANAPGQATAAANCKNVWNNIQLNLVAGGGPKSLLVVVDTGPPVVIGNSGPTNCDHFWQNNGSIGNG